MAKNNVFIEYQSIIIGIPYCMSSQKQTESAPILGAHMVSTITHPYCQLTITNTSTNQSKLANFVVDTGMWSTHSTIKQEVLDDIGLIPDGEGDTITGVGLKTSSYNLSPFVAVNFGNKRIITAFNVTPRGTDVLFSRYDGIVGINDIANLGIDIRLR